MLYLLIRLYWHLPDGLHLVLEHVFALDELLHVNIELNKVIDEVLGVLSSVAILGVF